ncbi:hypothetical protein NBRC3293_1708 [Gluconobacter oxydans NBRC 3293]|uniref:Uncharacterized protein n=1 Tax=Gluconobacter oxydans NBRC 3293 TaxID=1315969 RepID=A0A829WWV5_GLUOY|nr:hypothetical protein NBRC3293_1708 [Gluconobacter oxydans NBRC 3293]
MEIHLKEEETARSPRKTADMEGPEIIPSIICSSIRTVNL